MDRALALGVQVRDDFRCFVLFSRGQPDQHHVIVNQKAARTGGACLYRGDQGRRRTGSRVRQGRDQVSEMSRLIYLCGIDRRLAVLGGNDE